jgi:glucose/arabinose dehydrogenase
MSGNYFSDQLVGSTQFTGPLESPVLPSNNLSNPQTIAFIDPKISNATSLMASLDADVKVLLDSTRDGIAQITEELGKYQGLTGVSVLSHGDVAQLQLGNSQLSAGSLQEYGSQFQQWKSALTPGADLLFYACNLAQGDSGKTFINSLGKLTGADIAASINSTGANSQGGDWQLEYSTGSIETATPLSSAAIDSYSGILGPPVFLSDLTPTTAVTNGWGPLERDKSNGESAANDGVAMTLNGVSYTKGLGVHASSDITYNLVGGNYTRFTSDIGVDDEVGSNGSVVFQVWADGAQIYDSGIMTGSSATKTVDVDVTGKQNLRLLVLNGGDNDWFDHADWANAQLLSVPSGPDSSPPAARLTAPPISTSIAAPYTFTVTYTDDTGVNASTIDSSDVQITGAKGFSQIAQLVSQTPNTDSSSITATYQITAPDAIWNWNDRDTYTATLLPGAVRDTLGNTSAASTGLGTFDVTVDSFMIVGVNSSQVTEGNTVTIPIRRQGDTTGTAQVGYFIGGNTTAVAGVNYTAIPPGTLTFAPGETEKTVTVQTLDDGVPNTNATVSLLVETAVGAGLGPSRTSSISIRDRDALPNPSSRTYLSDLTPTSATNGWGPIELDKSNGERAAGDGNTLSLAGVSYNKGLGAHADSEITYNLGGAYNSFVSYVGVDDEVGPDGSVVFRILADGVLLFDSGVMTGTSKTQLANIDVTGKQTLSLVVNNGDNTYNADHADWADAQLDGGPPLPPTSTSIVPENVVTGLNRPTAFDWSPDGQLMFIAQKDGVVRTSAQGSSGSPPNPSSQLLPVQRYTTGTHTHGITSADFNGDGRLDIATANAGSNDISVLLGNGTGTFAPTANFGVGVEPKSVFAADFNRDGRIDLFTANQITNNVSVLLGNGDGTFAPSASYAGVPNAHEAVASDVDGDGDLDIAVAGWGSNTIRIMQNSGDGTFANFTDYSVDATVHHSLQLADFNGDGRPDLAVTNYLTTSISVLLNLNNGTGTFGSATRYTAGDGPHSMRAGDLNGDGRIDLVTANESSNNVSVLLGNGNGTFAPVVNYATGSVPKGVAIGDINGDGRVDLATANTAGNYPDQDNPGGNTISLLSGRGDGTFTAPTAYTTGRTPFSLNIADFNGDGRVDIASANWHTGDAGVLLNSPSAPGTPPTPTGVAPGLQATPFIDISSQVNNNTVDRGLLGMTVDPSFGRNQGRDYVYLLFTYDPPETQGNQGFAGPDENGNRPVRLIRVTADAATNYTTALPGSEVVLLGKNSLWQYTSGADFDSNSTPVDLSILASGIANGSTITPPAALIEDPDAANIGRDYLAADTDFDRNNNIRDYIAVDSPSHSGGQLKFGLDGSLYVTSGDGTSYNGVDQRTNRVQDVDNLSGKLLRINPLTGQGYADNPFANGDLDSNRSKVWSLGIRNSFRFAINPVTGDLYLGDVGWTNWEEINVAAKGANYGWPYWEGPVQNSAYSALPQAQAFYNSGQPPVAPLITRNHDASLNPNNKSATALILGDFYTGDTLPAIYNGALFYNDAGEGTVYATLLNPDGTVQSTQEVANLPFIVDTEMGPDGYLYYASLYGNAIGRWKSA